MKSAPTPVSRARDALNIPHAEFRHPGPVHSLEQAASERGQTPQQVIRSILFRVGDGKFVMVLTAGPAQVFWPALRTYLGQSRLTMATEEEVLAVTGYRVGAVSPFGLPAPLRILVDENILGQEEISLGSGERGVAIVLKSADMLKGLGDVEIVSVVKGD
jgi:prolyl-tRNA editing enzyme YbaK/EbsC (Cys-tRNA(Pro) deacylase)